MKKTLLLSTCPLLMLFSACSDPAAGGNRETAVVPNFEDVVMVAEAAENAPAEAPSDLPPPEGVVAPESGLSDEEKMARMTERDRAKYKEEMQAVWDAAKGEESTGAAFLGDIQQAVENYHFDNLKPPASLADLYKGGYLTYVPKIPAGRKLRIDGKTLTVTLE